MTQSPKTSGKRRRLSAETRRRQLIDAAPAIVLELGHLPIPVDKLAQAVGVSKALVYSHFPTQESLFNAIIGQAFADLVDAGLKTAAGQPTLENAALDCAMIYFDHVAETGPVLHVLLRDHFMVGSLDPEHRAFRHQVASRLARTARHSLGLGAKESMAAFNLITTIPEQAGTLAHSGEMDVARARELCTHLVSSSLEALVGTGEP